MNDAMTLLRLSVFACALAFTGCVETRFESPIGDKTDACDARWKGLWIDAGDSKDAAPADADAVFYVDNDCGFSALDVRDTGTVKQVRVPVNYAHLDGKDYVFVSDRDFKDIAEVKPPHGIVPMPEQSYFFARYEVRGDRLDFYLVDSDRTAKLVIDGKLDGTVDKANNELHVYVRGNRSQMQAIVRSQPVFDEKPVTLARSKQSLAEYERSLKRAGKRGGAR
jgi:hypothetical protein